MKLQISFTFQNVPYQYTINNNDIDFTHYSTLWDWWLGENDNEVKDRHYIDKPDDGELIFEVTADKFINADGKECISGNDIYINVYENLYADVNKCVIFANDIQVLYA